MEIVFLFICNGVTGKRLQRTLLLRRPTVMRGCAICCIAVGSTVRCAHQCVSAAVDLVEKSTRKRTKEEQSTCLNDRWRIVYSFVRFM